MQKALPPSKERKVLLVLVHPNDKKKGDTSNIREVWDKVVTFYDQASYGKFNVKYDVIGWYKLSGKAADYVTNDKDSQGKYKSYAPNVKQEAQTRLFAEVAYAALQAGKLKKNNKDNPDIMACIINLDGNDKNNSLRGQGDLITKNFYYNNDGLNIDIQLESPIGLTVVDERAEWGRCAHELGHFLVEAPTLPLGKEESELEPQQSEDLYPIVVNTDLPAASFDLMGHHEQEPLFSGYYMEKLEFYNSESIRKIDWNGELPSQSYKVAAHGLKENGGDVLEPGVYHLLKIYVSEGLSYYVEVRQRPIEDLKSTQLFDRNIPIAPMIHNTGKDKKSEDMENLGGVVVTQVFTDLDMNNNQKMRFINLLDYEYESSYKKAYKKAPAYPQPAVLKTGAVAIDPARGLRIEVVGPIKPCPLVYEVKVECSEGMIKPGTSMSMGGNPYGKYNLSIGQGDSPGGVIWESPDIWVELMDQEPLGNRSHRWYYGWDKDNKKPKYSGDRPEVGMSHRIWARVYFSGEKKATDVNVSFYAVTPPYVGNDGDWSSCLGHDTRDVPQGKNKDYTDFVAPVPWIPVRNDLTCIIVCIRRKSDERDYSDNVAKEIVFDLDLTPSKEDGVLKPISMPICVKNPFDTEEEIQFSYDAAPGFDVRLSETHLKLGPGDSTSINMTIEPTESFDAYIKREQLNSRIRVLGFVQKPNTMGSISVRAPDESRAVSAVPIQGITYWIGLKKPVSINLQIDNSASNNGMVTLIGNIDPPTGKKEKLHVEIRNNKGELIRSARRNTGTRGKFSVKFNDLGQGHYVASIIIDNSPLAASMTFSKEFDI